jgi:hypothetical protein
VYSPYEIEKGTALPLIKGRYDAYSKVLQRLTGIVDASSSSIRVTESQDQSAKRVPPAVPGEDSTPQPKVSPTPTTAGTGSSTGFPIVLVAVLAAVIVGIVFYFLRRESK